MTPETSKTHEVIPSSDLKPIMDTKAQITELICTYHPTDLHFDLFGNHVRGEDTFWVVDSGLYYQFMPSINYFPEFVS